MRNAGGSIPVKSALLLIALWFVVVLGPTTARALTAEQEAKLLPADGALDDYFGCSVALDGDTALIGARLDDDNGFSSGSAYVFTRAGTAWTQQAKLLPADGVSPQMFGKDVALDGDTAVMGAELDDDSGMASGAAYVFTRVGNVWTEQTKLLPADGASDQFFGTSVALDGDTAVIGADHDGDNGFLAGSAYVFTRVGGVWTEQAKLLPADGSPGDLFGSRVALDGDTVIVVAERDADNGEDSGSAYVFTRVGGTWAEQAKLLPADGAPFDYFGASTALDGDTAVFGVVADDDNGDNSGSAYVFVRTGGSWVQKAKLRPADGAAQDHFGRSVALEGDTLVITASSDNDSGQNSGSAYVFLRLGGLWTEQAKVLAGDGTAEDHFGESAALDGDTVVFGVPTDVGNVSGSAYVFRLFPDEVPAVSGIGTLMLLLTILGTGVYFVRCGKASQTDCVQDRRVC